MKFAAAVMLIKPTPLFIAEIAALALTKAVLAYIQSQLDTVSIATLLHSNSGIGC